MVVIHRVEQILEQLKNYDLLAISDSNEDFFCDNNLNISNLEFIIWKNLIKSDFQRIIFFDNDEKVYFFDKDSLNLFSGGNNVIKLNPGPLGNLNILSNSNVSGFQFKSSIKNGTIKTANNSKLENIVSEQNQKFQNKTNLSNSLKSFQDENIAKKHYEIILNSLEILIAENIPSLFVFRNPEEFLFSKSIKLAKNVNNFRIINPAIPLPNKLFKKLLNIRNNKNKLLFIFNKELEKIKDNFSENIFAENNQIEKYFLFQEIEKPDNEEIANLINHFRLMNNLKVEWENFDKTVEDIFRENLFLKDIYLKVNKLKSLSDLSFEPKIDSENIKLKNKVNQDYSTGSINWIEL